ncbi:MAG: exonuclease domain-containing protein [Bacteroidales bacterium]|nr:exonuclease domain-containing protein [Bacteroidales bacterium]
MIYVLIAVIAILLLFLLLRNPSKTQQKQKIFEIKEESINTLKNDPHSFIAIDFETAAPARNSACAVGLVLVSKGQIIDEYYTLIRPPENKFSVYNTRVHQIDASMTENSPKFKDVYPELIKLFNGNKIIAHNAPFDFDVFNKSAAYYNFPSYSFQNSADTLSIFGQKLNDCCLQYDIPLNHHNALSDARACAMLYLKYLDQDFKESVKSVEDQIKVKSSKYNEKITGNVLKPDFDSVFDSSNPFYKKKVVISGKFKNWSDRQLLADLLKELGADIDTTITKKTDILISGIGSGPAKIKRMTLNIENGNGQILNEKQLLELLNGIKLNSFIEGEFIKSEFINIESGVFYRVSSGQFATPNNIEKHNKLIEEMNLKKNNP